MRHHYGPSGYKEKTVIEKGTEEKPVYRAVEEGKGGATKTYMIVVDEGWRESIVCNGMYDWAAMWLVDLLQGKPYAPGVRP